MQSLALPGCSDLLSFKSHRFQTTRPGSLLRLNLADQFARPSWASLPSPPMSGSPPRRELIEPTQLAGQRRKRSDSPPTSPPASLQGQYPASTSQVESVAPTATAVERQVQPASYFPPYVPGPPYGYRTGASSSSMTTGLQESQSGYTQVSPRATRKVKAHVASACVNCKKKHLRCDSARPCQRCVQSGKESTCYDVEHRKRGRPPLKPDDPSTRGSFEQSSRGLPAPSHGHSRRGSQQSLAIQSQPSSAWRDIRPILSRGVSDSGSSMYPHGPSFSSMYAQPSIASSATTAVGTMTRMGGSSYQVPAPRAQPSYSLQSQMGYGTASYDTYQQSQAQPRNYPGYMSQQHYSPPTPSNYTYLGYQRPAPVPPIPEEGPVGLYGSSSLQLPPIRPAPQGQMVEPAMAQQQRQAVSLGQYYPSEQSSVQDSNERPDAKRPRMDIQGILDPKQD